MINKKAGCPGSLPQVCPKRFAMAIFPWLLVLSALTLRADHVSQLVRDDATWVKKGCLKALTPKEDNIIQYKTMQYIITIS